MKIYEIATPAVLVDLDKLEKNIHTTANMVRSGGKSLWPMFKTTKSTFIARLQRYAGSNGFLCSNVGEAKTLVSKGITKNVMIAYPVVDRQELNVIADIIEKGARVIVRIDNLRTAEIMSKELKTRDLRVEYCVKVDVDYGRLGVKPKDVGAFATKLKKFSNLVFAGIVTHQGNAYKARSPAEVKNIAKYCAKLMETAVNSLKKYNIEPQIIGAGSTPTLRFDVAEEVYTHLFPGNYVYFDRTQALAYGSASIKDCAQTLLATVISKPQHSENKIAIVNAGSKYIEATARGGLRGYGQLVEHPKAVVSKVSQEIAILDTSKDNVDVGEKVRIITNHSCYTNNAVNLIVGHRGPYVEGLIPIDSSREAYTENILVAMVRKLLN